MLASWAETGHATPDDKKLGRGEYMGMVKFRSLRQFSVPVAVAGLAVVALNSTANAVDLNREPAHGAPVSSGDEKYKVVFTYELKNKTRDELKNVKVWFPLPFDDAGQKVTNLALIKPDGPADQEKTQDQFDQQIMATTIHSIPRGGKVKVGFECDVVVHPLRADLARERAGELKDIPADIRKMYTGDLKGVYDIDSPIIQNEAKSLVSRYPNVVDRVIAIHDLVAGRIKYSLSGGWSPAPAVFERKTGSCSEYSFLFASLCRATGLPTRMVGSSHLRTTTEFPYEDTAWHRWVEVYVPGLDWVPFDPTIDRGRVPKRDCCGSYDFRTLRVSRGGCESNILGQAYVGTNDQEKAIARSKSFVWTRIN